MSQKSVTKNYFDQTAGEWRSRVYDLNNKKIKFPSARVRKEITIKEIQKRGKGRVLDMGCGSGELVADLLKLGYRAEGFDIAPKMIDQAKTLLKKEKILKKNFSKEEIFKVNDLYDFKSGKLYDFITAMGFVEYLESDNDFFPAANKLLKKGGYVMAEFRNKHFNLFTGNEYTEGLLKNQAEAAGLIKELEQIEKYTALKLKDIPGLELEIFAKINAEIKKMKKIDLFTRQLKYKEIPKKIVRRQHTAETIKKLAEKYGFKLEYLVYYHAHPFLPRYEKHFPILFNTLGLAMQPLGYTPLGASICSAFVAVLRKK